ncbi:MAG: hypothetical protein QOE58_515 [Actinomycetota bacterium]|nr:hypothetical protein [Actinomycetota bacterium]
MRKLKEELARQQTASPKAPAAKPAPKAQAAPRQAACGGNLSVGANTSCAFGTNVEAAFYAAGGGTNRVEVCGPVTGKYYTMRLWHVSRLYAAAARCRLPSLTAT